MSENALGKASNGSMDKDFSIVLIGLYAAMLGIANIAAVKIVSINGWEFTAGVLPIAAAYLISDIGVEKYGQRFGHKLVWSGVIALLSVVVITQLVVHLPGESVVDDVFASSLPVLLASIITIVVAQHTDVWLFVAIRERLPYRASRNIGSTTLSQLLDTTLFTVLAFSILPFVVGGVQLSITTMATIIATEYIVKTALAVIDTPLFLLSTNES
jgi:uncharacterized integral membrane protein (TIGR00697 family)